MKEKSMERGRALGNLALSAAMVLYTASLYNFQGFDFLLGLTMIFCSLIVSTQMLVFFRRVGTLPTWLALTILCLAPIFLAKDAGTGLLIGAISVSIPLAVSLFWPPMRKIAPLTKAALPAAGAFLFFGTLGYSALHFDTFSFAPIQERIAEKWIALIKETEPMIKMIYPEELYEKMKEPLELLAKPEQANTFAFSLLMNAVIAMFGIFFIAVFWADHRMKRAGERRWCGSWSQLIPQRGISWLYMLASIFCSFLPEKIYLPLNATLILFGFFFVFTAVYKLERLLARKRVHGALRALIVIALMAAAYFTAGGPLFTVYTAGMFIGWWIATSPVRVAVIKK